MKTTVSLVCLLAGLFQVQSASFIPLKGSYNGLFFETNNVWRQSSGSLTLKTTTKGTYSAKVQIGLQRYSFSGQFASDGSVNRVILRRFDNPLTIQIQVASDDPDLIFGTVSDGTWFADLFADRAVFDNRIHNSPDAGQYTLALLGDFNSTNTPGGANWGTLTVSRSARLTFAGVLGDGTRVTQSSTVSKGGQWPLYLPLYQGGGSLYGWMLFNAATNSDISGDPIWIKPEIPSSWYYPGGFAVQRSAIGSRFVRPPAGSKILNVTDATLEFNGGNLYRGITNVITLGANSRVQNSSPNGLRITFSHANGSFGGTVMDPYSFEWIPFRGVVLQRHGLAAGNFPGWDQTGEVWLQGL